MMRWRAILLLVTIVGALVVGTGVALAATFDCTTNPCLGTPEADTIHGTDNSDKIKALAGGDWVIGYGGNDEVHGDEGNDVVTGYPSNDTIYGGPDGNGSVYGTTFISYNLEGEQDSDKVYGGGGDDWIDAAADDLPYESSTEPVDQSYGGKGNDHIFAIDGNKDIINCGKGKRDIAYIDPPGTEGKITGCKQKIDWG